MPKNLSRIPAPPDLTVDDLARRLQEAWYSSRPIVPIVGAGLSADCGFPVIASVERYLGKLHQYIHQRAFLPSPDEVANADDPLYPLFKMYREQPWRYVEHFGWPDRYHLNEDLLSRLQQSPPKEWVEVQRHDLLEWAAKAGLEAMVTHVNSVGSSRYGKRKDKKNPQDKDSYTGLRGAIDDLIQGVLGPADANPIDGIDPTDGLAQEIRRRSTGKDSKALLATICDKVQQRLDRYWSTSAAYHHVGDWRRLLLYFTNFQSDYADALFLRFGSGRRQGQGHRFLAFLVKLLAVRAVFTFNFDTFIEQALGTDGLRPTVFDMERGAGLPHPSLVRDQLSVIKMHGSTHALLLDEQLDRPLSEEYLGRFDQITGSDPLLLVIGCSADDKRVRVLVEHVLTRHALKQRAEQTPSAAVRVHSQKGVPLTS